MFDTRCSLCLYALCSSQTSPSIVLECGGMRIYGQKQNSLNRKYNKNKYSSFFVLRLCL